MEISAAMVRALREKTGLPMMECKKALEEAGGDMTGAVELLRKKGMAQASKRAGRETGHGRILLASDSGGQRAALVEVLCETEPVAGTEDFIKLGQAAAQVAVACGATSADAILQQPLPSDRSRTVNDLLHDVVNKIRENIRIGRVGVLSGSLGHYLHHDHRKGVLVEFSADCPATVKADVCMHIVSIRPACTRREEVDPQLVEAEKKIAAEQVKDKPANMIEKIVMGKINRWYSETVLLEQPFVKEEKKSVGQILKEVSPALTVNRFIRFEIGEA